MSEPACHLCGKPVDPRTAWPEAAGYERKATAPDRRGGSDIILRKRTGRVACDECIVRLQAGLDVRQESLL